MNRFEVVLAFLERKSALLADHVETNGMVLWVGEKILAYWSGDKVVVTDEGTNSKFVPILMKLAHSRGIEVCKGNEEEKK